MKGMAGVVAVASLAAAIAWAGAAFSAPQATPSATTLAKKVKQLERRVNALALLQAGRRDPTLSTTTSWLPMTPLGNKQYYGTATCYRGHRVGGGVQLGTGGFVSDHIFHSYPTATGWYGQAVSSGGIPSVYAVCAELR